MAVFILVETFRNPGEPSKEGIRVRPVDGQPYPPSMRVSCSTYWRDKFPLGSKFKFSVVEERRGGVPFLRVVGNPPWLPIEEETTAGKSLKRTPRTSSTKRRKVGTSAALLLSEVYPGEIDEEGEGTFEGAKKSVVVNVFERDRAARLKCIQHHGAVCIVCKIDFSAVYGRLGAGFIHVHHIRPLGEIREEYELDPIKDLRPVCPNCHSMLHRRRPALSIEYLRGILVKRSHTRVEMKSKSK
jgi:hypothetical protein